MAKKGGKRSGGGGGKQRKYTRDNNGRFASTGTGATARGGRLKTASGNKRKTQTAKMTGSKTASTIAKPKGLKPGTLKPKAAAAKPAAPKALRVRMQTTAAGPRTGAQSGVKRRTTQAAAPKNTTANRTGQSKTLNKFNSRPVGTMVAGKGSRDELVPSTKRVPLDIQRKVSDQAFARTATKAVRAQAKIPAQRAAKQTTAQRAARAVSNQKQVVASIQAKGGRRPTPSRKQRRSLLTAEAAKRFYSSNAIDTLKVNVKKPGFRLPRAMR